MAEGEKNEMSAIGKKLWLYMQERGPYNQRAFARMLKRRGILNTTHQSISAWLHKDQPATYFINALVEALELNEQEEIDLHYMYFYGEPRPSTGNLRVADSVEAEAEREVESVPEDQRARSRR